MKYSVAADYFPIKNHKVEKEEIAEQKRTAIICTGRLLWCCHRLFIALELEGKEWQVSHIIDKRRESAREAFTNDKQLKLT